MDTSQNLQLEWFWCDSYFFHCDFFSLYFCFAPIIAPPRAHAFSSVGIHLSVWPKFLVFFHHRNRQKNSFRTEVVCSTNATWPVKLGFNYSENKMYIHSLKISSYHKSILAWRWTPHLTSWHHKQTHAQCTYYLTYTITSHTQINNKSMAAYLATLAHSVSFETNAFNHSHRQTLQIWIDF